MKKMTIMAALVLATAAASATDFGIRTGRYGVATPTDSGATASGITIGQQFGKFGAEFGYDHGSTSNASGNRYSLTGSYPVGSLAGLKFAAKAGAVYLDPSVGQAGYAGTVGVGAAYPLTKSVSLVADYAYQVGQERVKAFNGNTVSIGAKYSF